MKSLKLPKNKRENAQKWSTASVYNRCEGKKELKRLAEITLTQLLHTADFNVCEADSL